MLKRIPAVALVLLITVSVLGQDRGAGGTMPAAPGGVSGYVTSVSGNMITVLNGVVAIDTTGAAFFSRKGSASIADVKPGMRIMASIANPGAGPGTPLHAMNVTILETSAGSLNGPVQSVDAPNTTFTVFGAFVKVTPDTKIYSFRREAATFADIRPGDVVAVEVNVAGSALVAESVHIQPPVPNVSLEGTVKSISPTAWVITTAGGDITVAVNADTRIDTTVKVGDSVNVLGITNGPAGEITAIAIYASKPRPVPPPGEPALEGTVKSIGATSWVITTRGGDVTVTVNSETKIDPAVKAGDYVLVLVKRDASGNIVAVAIMKAEKRRTVRS